MAAVKPKIPHVGIRPKKIKRPHLPHGGKQVRLECRDFYPQGDRHEDWKHGEWFYVATMTEAEAIQFLIYAGAALALNQGEVIYVDHKNNEYRIIPLLH
jgi:hypothetical protein